MDHLQRLRTQAKALGLDKRPLGSYLLRLMGHVAIALAGSALFYLSHHGVLKVLGILIATFGATGVGTHAHTASHNAASTTPWVNKLLTYFGYPFFLQLSATSWWQTHVVLHHTAPNVIGVDTDCDLMPWLALHTDEAAQGGPARRLYYRYQAYLMPLLILFDGPMRQLRGFGYVLSALRDPERRRLAHFFDLVAMLLHYGFWLVLPALFFPVGQVLLFHYGRLLLMGYALFAILGPAHYVKEAIVFHKSEKSGANFLLLQTAATVNFSTGPVGRYLIAGLGNQIEHHLFPNISHVHIPRLSRLVKETCEREGYPYRTFTWSEALRKTFAAFHTKKPIAPSLAPYRAAQEQRAAGFGQPGSIDAVPIARAG